MTNASLFVMPSYHEGLPIALLEAMSYDLDVVVSDIPANRLNILEDEDFFQPATPVHSQKPWHANCRLHVHPAPTTYRLTTGTKSQARLSKFTTELSVRQRRNNHSTTKMEKFTEP